MVLPLLLLLPLVVLKRGPSRTRARESERQRRNRQTEDSAALGRKTFGHIIRQVRRKSGSGEREGQAGDDRQRSTASGNDLA